MWSFVTTGEDADSDGINDALDNCSAEYNPNQLDTDDDGYGDACDPDDDADKEPSIQDRNGSKRNYTISNLLSG